MNRTALLALVLWLCFPAFAREGKTQQDLMQSLFTPDLINAHSQEIGLTKDQETKLVKELKTFTGENAELKWALDREVGALAQTLGSDHVDEAKSTAQISSLIEKEGAMKRARLSYLIRIKNLLTAEQQQKLAQIRSRKLSEDSKP